MKELTDQSSVDGRHARSARPPTSSSSARSPASGWPSCRATAAGHRLLPSEIPYLANIHALRQLGVEHLISVSAVGSMREEIAPGHICLPDQFIDLTQGRPRTFFGGGVVGHIPFDKPVCADLAEVLHRAGKKAGAVMHTGGTYVCIEGPQFSTLAESKLYRTWGVDVIGMTNLPEARLAREAEMCYATLALATDYDCWHETEEVSVEQILKIINQNVSLAQEIIRRAVALLPEERACALRQRPRARDHHRPRRRSPPRRAGASTCCSAGTSPRPRRTDSERMARRGGVSWALALAIAAAVARPRPGDEGLGAARRCRGRRRSPSIPGFFDLTFSRNTGGVFGLLAGRALARPAGLLRRARPRSPSA